MSLSVSLICQSFNIISSLKILQNFFFQNQSFPGEKVALQEQSFFSLPFRKLHVKNISEELAGANILRFLLNVSMKFMVCETC